MKLINLLCASSLILLSSCAATKKTTTAVSSLYETKWLLKKIYTDGVAEQVQTKAFLQFDEGKKSAGGNGSCNTFGSSTTINNNEINFKNIFSTRMYCEEVQKTENAYFNQLKKVNRFEIKEKTLLLYNDKDVLLEFVAE